MKKKKSRTPSVKHYVWEEDGKKFSSWKIDAGSGPILNTGAAGMEMFEKALKEAFLKGLKFNEDGKENGSKHNEV